MKLVPWLELASLLLLAAPLEAKLSPGVVATVNGQPITRSELDRQTDGQMRLISVGYRAADSRDNLRRQELDVLIARDLLIQAFHQSEGKVPQSAIDEKMDEIIRQEYGGSRGALEKTLRDRGLSVDTYRREIADNYAVFFMRTKSISLPALRQAATIEIGAL